MDDWFHKLTKWVSHNRGLFIGLLLAAGLTGLVSCESRTEDPVSGKPVTGDQLVVSEEAYARRMRAAMEAAAKQAAAQVDAVKRATEARLAEIAAGLDQATAERVIEAEEMTGRFDAAHEEIARQDRLKGTVFNMVRDNAGRLDTLAPGAGSVLAGIFGLLAVGVGLDNRRKDRVIKANGQAAPPATPATPAPPVNPAAGPTGA